MIIKVIIQIFAFTFLTILTQIGGVIYLITLGVSRLFNLAAYKAIILFAGLYLSATFIFVPILAHYFGRTALPTRGNLRPLTIVTALLNRHYVQLGLKNQLVSVAEEMNKQFENTAVNYLDANFPFFDGFPLFPHLSHSDGRKVDLAFLYTDVKTMKMSGSAPSFIGYGVYESPVPGEVDYPAVCREKGYFQYGLLTYIVPKWNARRLKVDVERTTALIRMLAVGDATSKIFIEPHLKERWGLSEYEKIRFHGCQAVRHDDHIHTQIY